MKQTQVTLSKQILIPTGEFSNERVGAEVTFSVDESFDIDLAWVEVNNSLASEVLQIQKDAEAKKKAVVTPTILPMQPVSPVQEAMPTGTVSMCNVHKVWMKSAVSKKTNKPYFFHDLPEGRCFGKGVVPKQ